MSTKSGADITPPGGADNSTIEDAVRSARKYGVEMIPNLVSVDAPVNRAKKLEELGIECIYVLSIFRLDQKKLKSFPMQAKALRLMGTLFNCGASHSLKMSNVHMAAFPLKGALW